MVGFMEKNDASVNGRPSERLALVTLPNKPCGYAVKKGPCKFCAFWNVTYSEKSLTFEEALKQIRKGRVQLFSCGSILDAEQVPRIQLKAMLKLLAKTPAEAVYLESRPEYITPELIRWVKDILGNKILEIAIGLETTNEALRESFGKGFSKWEFYDAVHKIVAGGAFPVAYLLTGLLQTEKEAYEDLLTSAHELFTMQKAVGIPISIALESFFPVNSSQLPARYIRPEFIARVTAEIVRKFGMNVFVATSSEGLTVHPLYSMRVALEFFNATQDTRCLDAITQSVSE